MQNLTHLPWEINITTEIMVGKYEDEASAYDITLPHNWRGFFVPPVSSCGNSVSLGLRTSNKRKVPEVIFLTAVQKILYKSSLLIYSHQRPQYHFFGTMYHTAHMPTQNGVVTNKLMTGSLPLFREMVAHIASQASQVIQAGSTAEIGQRLSCTPSTTFSLKLDALTHQELFLPPIEFFIEYIIKRSNAPLLILLISLVYMTKLKARLPDTKGALYSIHRIFLACLMLAARNLRDGSPKPEDWARYCRHEDHSYFDFSVNEVYSMEGQLMVFLTGELKVQRQDLDYQLMHFLQTTRKHYAMRANDDQTASDYESLQRILQEQISQIRAALALIELSRKSA